ncbi:hypothetical protein ASB62_03275 [Chlorobium limicola]|uniref:Uncharacterized protein n=1 Tax=Chlorobium limicola TaxID=1092 RepID=A0A101JQ99_CHLLI|nr:hypothetical protein ASB62_03275 [Chlorobium limicola]
MIMRYKGTDILSAAVVGQNILSPFALSRVFYRDGSAYRRVSGVRNGVRTIFSGIMLSVFCCFYSPARIPALFIPVRPMQICGTASRMSC